jgi:hypothetical protein
MSARQGGRCPICERDLGDKPQVDHDHKTGEVGALLCFNCNGGLGQFGDDPERLRQAALYLEGFAPPRVVEAALRRALTAAAADGVTAYLPRPHDPRLEYVTPHAWDDLAGSPQ